MRDCENCKHRIMKVEVGKGTPPDHFWGCECWECEFEPTTKNDLGVDCVARQDVERYIEGFINEYTPREELEFINLELDGLKHIPSVTPQEPFINKACVSSGVCEHDKNKVLDKIRAEIEKRADDYFSGGSYDKDLYNSAYKDALYWCFDLIDKYKAEKEDT